MMEKDKIYIIYGDSPKEMIKEIFYNYPPPMENLDKDARIALKPNLVHAKYSESGATTSPLIVAGVLEFLQENDFKNIVIMESSSTQTSTEKAFDVCGYTQLSREYGVPLIDLKEHEYERVNYGSHEMDVFKRPMNVDYFINIPVLKAHCQTNMTCALKNLKGCITDKEKSKFHSLGIHEPVANLNKIIETNLVVVDGLMGDLSHEAGGNPVEMGRIMAVLDPVLVDSYAARLLGYELEEVEYIKLAKELNVGELYRDESQVIEMDRDKMPDVSTKSNNFGERYSEYVEEDSACSPCFGSLIHALARLEDKNKLRAINEKIYVGRGYENQRKEGIGIGVCTKNFTKNIKGCPPEASDIVRYFENELN